MAGYHGGITFFGDRADGAREEHAVLERGVEKISRGDGPLHGVLG